MSTRKLILTALVCGLAIVVAGGLKLFQVAGNDPKVEALRLGESVLVADMTVSADSIRATEAATFVTVTIYGVDGADAVEGWRLISGGEVVAPLTGDDPAPGTNLCVVTRAATPTTCVVPFPAVAGSVTVAYLRGGAQSQWAP